jgi:predicted TIM-barrel fold metal-dependent hydrolase
MSRVLDEMDANGVERAVLTVFASDAPVLSITRTIGEAMALDLPDQVRDNYLYGNARRFFFDRLSREGGSRGGGAG